MCIPSAFTSLRSLLTLCKQGSLAQDYWILLLLTQASLIFAIRPGMPAMSHKTQPGIQTHRYTQVSKVHIPVIYTYSQQSHTGRSHTGELQIHTFTCTHTCTLTERHSHMQVNYIYRKIKHADIITHTDMKITHTGERFCTTYIGQVVFRSITCKGWLTGTLHIHILIIHIGMFTCAYIKQQ